MDEGDWSGGAAFIDGGFCQIQDARISVLDLGLTRSDCTYDVVHVWEGRFYRVGDHLERFFFGMDELRLAPGYDRREVEQILHGCVSRTGLRNAYVSMTCTRGRLPAGSRDLREARPTFYCFAGIQAPSPRTCAAGTGLGIATRRGRPPCSTPERCAQR